MKMEAKDTFSSCPSLRPKTRLRIFGLAGVSLALLSSPAIAGDVLWNGVEAGMPATELKSLFPKTDRQRIGSAGIQRTILRFYKLTPDCGVRVVIEHPAGRVSEVRLDDHSRWNCVTTVQAGLFAKYGNPDQQSSFVERTRLPGPLGALNEDSDKEAFTWFRDRISIRFEKGAGCDPSSWCPWTITYTPVATATAL